MFAAAAASVVTLHYLQQKDGDCASIGLFISHFFCIIWLRYLVSEPEGSNSQVLSHLWAAYGSQLKYICAIFS